MSAIDDLVGVRLLHLHTKQMADIHPVITGVEQGVPLWKVEGGPAYQTDEARSAFAGMARELIRRTTAEIADGDEED